MMKLLIIFVTTVISLNCAAKWPMRFHSKNEQQTGQENYNFDQILNDISPQNEVYEVVYEDIEPENERNYDDNEFQNVQKKSHQLVYNSWCKFVQIDTIAAGNEAALFKPSKINQYECHPASPEELNGSTSIVYCQVRGPCKTTKREQTVFRMNPGGCWEKQSRRDIKSGCNCIDHTSFL